MHAVLILSSEGDAWRARDLEPGLVAQGFDVRRLVPAPGVSPWSVEPAPDVVVCVGWETLAAFERSPFPVVLDLPQPRLAEEPAGPDRTRRAQDKLAALRLADYFTCASPRQQLYFRSWLVLAEIPNAEARLAVVPAGPGAATGGWLAPEAAQAVPADAVAPLAEYLRVARIQPAPALAPAPERLKRPGELLAEVRYHLRHGGVRAVAVNAWGFAGKLRRRAVLTRR